MSLYNFTGMDAEDRKLAELVRCYLLEGKRKWRCPHHVKTTIRQVLALDGDLKSFVRDCLEKHVGPAFELGYEGVLVSDLLKTGFTPIGAALLIQWYRKDPVAAARTHYTAGGIVNIPDEFMELDEEKAQRGGKMRWEDAVEACKPTKVECPPSAKVIPGQRQSGAKVAQDHVSSGKMWYAKTT